MSGPRTSGGARAFRFDPTARGAALSLCEAAIAAAFPGVPEIAAPDLAARLAAASTPPPLLLDVRTEEEHAVGRLPGARRVEPGARAGDALPRDGRGGGGIVVCVCAVGLRSARLARALLDDGLPPGRVFNLRGGVFRWARLGLPMVDARGRPTRAVHPFDARWGRLLDR